MFLDIQADPSIPVLRNGPFQRPEIHFLLIQIVILGRYVYIYSNLYRNNRMDDLYTFEHGLFFFVRCVSGDLTLKHVEHSM